VRRTEVIEVRSINAMKTRREHEIRGIMNAVFKNYKDERDAFVKRVEDGLLVNAFALRPVLKSQGDMLPWGRVQKLLKTGTGLYRATLEVRENCVRTLLGYGEAQSSDLLALDIDRVERDGMRRFVNVTSRFMPQPAVEVPVMKVAAVTTTEESDE
jgi:hypothetical protein